MINGKPKGLITPSPRRPTFSLPLSTLYIKLDLITLSQCINKLSFGIRICRYAPQINHLLFANNSILFYKVKVEKNKRIQQLLATYERTSGQQINKEKISIFFSTNVKPTKREQIWALWEWETKNLLENTLAYFSWWGKRKQDLSLIFVTKCGKKRKGGKKKYFYKGAENF